MYVVVWEYLAHPERVDAFVEAYGAMGAWARLFRRGDGFLGVQLLRDLEEPTRFVTIDRWRSRDAFTAFMTQHRALYVALDEKLADLTLTEMRLGDCE
ncbi:antibiotic biosynthesis monooxygenase family protein [Caulobacter sp. CCUG 60055]|uniref:antibiotic biosynthesis monooxygenase family protein n=1 Tax=Caulobacter sp. CCUG 60055 TaxID=2100090 RepID=UPI002418A006|nr:antibiotic biosynthesis monooxygenase family protein [Caulobacter sp. CCUG 60055]